MSNRLLEMPAQQAEEIITSLKFRSTTFFIDNTGVRPVPYQIEKGMDLSISAQCKLFLTQDDDALDKSSENFAASVFERLLQDQFAKIIDGIKSPSAGLIKEIRSKEGPFDFGSTALVRTIHGNTEELPLVFFWELNRNYSVGDWIEKRANEPFVFQPTWASKSSIASDWEFVWKLKGSPDVLKEHWNSFVVVFESKIIGSEESQRVAKEKAYDSLASKGIFVPIERLIVDWVGE